LKFDWNLSSQDAAVTSLTPSYDHIVVVVEENHSLSGIIGNPQAQFIDSLANGGALLTNYHAVTHPSEPNYFALYAGSTFGVADDADHVEPGPTLASILQAGGKTFTGYIDTGSPRKHNPWESFSEGLTVERNFSAFPSSDFSLLPAVSFVIPNLIDDMHDGTVAQGDQWLQSNLGGYAQWALTHNSLLIVVWDEDDFLGTNLVPAILYGAHVKPGQYTTSYNHYDLLNTLLTANNLQAPNNAANAMGIGNGVFINGPPAITSNGGGDSASIAISENTIAVTKVVATDPDVGTTLTYAIAGGADAAQFQIDAATGALSFKIAPDYEFRTDADHNNSYIVQVRASDDNLADDQTITVNVSDIRVANDFNADETSDVFWRNNSTGHTGLWVMNNGVQTWQDLGGSGADHKVAGIGDFNGDGSSDILWRNDSTGHVGIWEMHNNVQTWHDLGGSGVDHKAVGIGDFNGDGTADVFWRNDSSGHVGIWEMHNNVATWRDLGGSGVDHKVVGIGDFNGDSTADIFWRNDSSGHVGIWEMHNNVATWRDLGGSGVDHKVVGIGDFNGDGTADMLWRNDASGHVGIWEMHNNVQTWHDLGGSGVDHKVAGIGDYNGDGTSDVFWRNDASGHVGIWEMHNNVPTWYDLGGSGVDHSFIV
jgi:hypothetical protein